MKIALDAIVEESGADLLLYTKIIGVEKPGDSITRLHIAEPTSPDHDSLLHGHRL